MRMEDMQRTRRALGKFLGGCAALALCGACGPAFSQTDPALDVALAELKRQTAALVTAAPRVDTPAASDRIAAPPVIWRVPGAITQFSDCSGCPQMVVIPAGEFTMGAPATELSGATLHRVRIEAPFAVSKFEITF